MLPAQVAGASLAASSQALISTAPHVAAAITITTTNLLSRSSQQMHRLRDVRSLRARHMHWMCRRSSQSYRTAPRFYTASQVKQHKQDGDKIKNGEESRDHRERKDDRNGNASSARERVFQARRELWEQMMKKDSYETLFGRSNFMLKGLNWKDWPMKGGLAADIRTMMQWSEEKAKRMEKLADKMVEAELSERDASSATKTRTQGPKVESSSEREYDAVSGRMVPKHTSVSSTEVKLEKNNSSGEPIKNETVSIPVKTFRPQVDSADIAKQTNTPPPADHSVPEGWTTAASLSGQSNVSRKQSMPDTSMGRLSAEIVRSRMGQQAVPPRVEDGSSQRSAQLIDRAKRIGQTRPAESKAPETQHPANGLSKLQRQQLAEAAEAFTTREKQLQKQLRSLKEQLPRINADAVALRDRCNDLAKNGVLTVKTSELNSLMATQHANDEVLRQAQHLLSAAVMTGPQALSRSSTGSRLETSLDRYAWDKKPFAKIRNADALIQNVQESLETSQDLLKSYWRAVKIKSSLAGSLNEEVEGMKQSMRGIEEKWHKRDESLHAPSAPHAVPVQVSPPEDPALSALAEQVEIGLQHQTGIEAENEASAITLGAVGLGNIPDLEPASLDGGLTAEPAEPRSLMAELEDMAASAPNLDRTAESIYTILALDPAMGSITTATTTSSADTADERPMQLSHVLQQLAQPVMFLPYLPKLKAQGFEPVKASENLLVLKKTKMPASTATIAGSSETRAVIEGAGAIETKATEHGQPQPQPVQTEAEADNTGSAANHYYSTKFQSAHPGIFNGLRPKRTEAVFSGTQGGHERLESLRTRLREAKHRDQRAFVRGAWRRRRGFGRRAVRFVGRALWVAFIVYVIGAVVEMNRRVDERVERARRRRVEREVDAVEE